MKRSMLPSLFDEDGNSPPLFKSLHKEIDRVFDDFKTMVPGWGNGDAMEGNGRIVPKLDVSETDKAVEVSAELPGVEEKDIDISVSGNVLTLKGEKSSKREEEDKNYRLVERSYGSFARALPLPFDINAKDVSADFDSGVLTVTVKKPPEAETKTQKIKISKST